MNNILNKNNSLSIWLKYLEKLDKKIILDLNELKSIAKKLDLLTFRAFIFTVAGTNGKGTTCAMLEKLLLNSGYQVGLYTSPHLISYLERVRINGSVLTSEEHINSFQEIEIARNSTLLSYFEFITLSALLLFKRYSLDVIILEVGLGGRLDATNIIDSNLSIITNIEIDHSVLLGHTRSSIAREKSGIFRKNKISVIGEINIPSTIDQEAQVKKTILKKNNRDWFLEKYDHYWNFIHEDIKLYGLPNTQIPISNTALALAALYYSDFKISEKVIRTTIPFVRLPGRFQIISVCPHIIIDVAHNLHSALYLFNKIDSMNIKGKIYAIVGMLEDKDINGIVNPFKRKIHYWYAAPLKTSRTATIKQLKKSLPSHNTKILSSIHETYKKVLLLVKKQDAILVFGSFFTVSEFIKAKKLEDNINIFKNAISEK
ncbi:bifunctional tetrahydrofolate synthase/dihydrofolate synthase [Buchnera aphidicola]|uniref:Dihydrofolate synthase/folylpolyglutamate synthase n=1 Tax=Buchnera aphidicola str. USDA (Myzus persicae) TaxID=1009856 RepID=W0P0G0_BUCMP|nr:bifunctional tetrahydrofolate synthase/dihydrofolate synthase [Buchnera aphidicola]AHG60204.1 Folc [Buchnera aphidicola str. USDA (Myzus persicae)]AHG60782.1 Folc [Buchnera aphidicola str. W106 (Myzus persicae)]AHG61354.1 Folc [Buchnera aphidicola str. G002 (Myzus persicae)]AHG61927.1 Folc [Buchnera aphidicola str. F009 (Myzus persicae)]WAI03108.1 MAG: bifunctional tetrahydrofolate synthase/dihydrofolate synthase [Buchnera aphidicola (Myzus persicae)]